MTEDHQIALTAAFDRWFKGDQSASRMCALLTEVAHVWDDLVDRDKDVPPAVAARAFRTLTLELPTNAFYRANFNHLHPVMCSVWAQWTAANQIEADPKYPIDKEKCLMLRASLYQLFHTVALLCGGLDWAEQIGPDIYRTYGETMETIRA